MNDADSMLDDNDTFQQHNLYAEMLLRESKGLIEILKQPNLKPSKLSWFLFLRNFMIKHAEEIDTAISVELGRENVPH